MIWKTCQVYQKFTRASNHNNYFIPHFKSSKTQRSIKYQGPLVWNSLETSLKTCKTLNYFKAKLKKLLLNKYTNQIKSNKFISDTTTTATK